MCVISIAWTLRSAGVLAGVENVLAMVGCCLMTCSVNSTSCHISLAPWELLMVLMVFAQSAMACITLSACEMVG